MPDGKGDFEVALLLCDWAETINGKLYIMGGGWTNIVMSQPVTLALAANIAVPWHATNQKHKIRATLLTEDGQTVLQMDGDLEVGRPPGARVGMAQNAPLSLRVQNYPLQAGSYSWRFEINGEEHAHVAFRASTAPGYVPPQLPQQPQAGEE